MSVGAGRFTGWSLGTCLLVRVDSRGGLLARVCRCGKIHGVVSWHVSVGAGRFTGWSLGTCLSVRVDPRGGLLARVCRCG